MRAIRLYEFGAAGNLRVEEMGDPGPGEGQVRVVVGAAGVHLMDTALRRGESFGPAKLSLPAVPGREVAGVVDAVGDGVDAGWVGKRVVTHLGPNGSGGYAELAVAEAARLYEVPEHVSFEVAVAMIGTGRTAVGILRQAAITADDVVLVTAAAGGLGALFVQAALDAGARVVGAAGGPAKVEIVRGLGATLAVDYDRAGWADEVRAAGLLPTVALDGVGGDAGRAALELLAPGGRLLMFGWSAGKELPLSAADLWRGSLSVSVVLGPNLMKGGIEALERESLDAAAAGRLVPLTTTFPLEQAAAAHTALETRRTTGKVVLVL